MKIAISLVIGFALGFLTYSLVFGQTTKNHWKVVADYNAYVTNRANFKPDPQTGFLVSTPPPMPLPALEALVATGELKHLDIVFPAIPYGSEVARHWLKFCAAHQEIVFITGNPSSTAFKPAGKQPLHLNIWFKPADGSVVQMLIQELEVAFAK